MKMKLAALAVAALMIPVGSHAEYPEGPVQFVVPWPPGDLEDIVTRMIADQFQDTYDVPAAVVNKPGGGGGPFPGAVEVALAPADGYTVGSFVIGVPVIGPNIGIAPLTPDPFDPVGIFLTYPFVIAAAADAPYASMEELSEYARENPVTLGHFGERSIPRRHAVALANTLGYSYHSEAAFDALDCNTLASGDADVITTTVQLIMPCLGDLKILAAATDQRIEILPDVPTIGEIAPQLALSTWNGLFVRKDTPQEARDAIAKAAQQVVNSDTAKELSRTTGALLYWKDSAASKAQIASDIEVLKRIDALLPAN